MEMREVRKVYHKGTWDSQSTQFLMNQRYKIGKKVKELRNLVTDF